MDRTPPQVDLQTDRPHPARVYDYLLGGKDNFAADRVAAEQGHQGQPREPDAAAGEPGVPAPRGALPGRGARHRPVPRHRYGHPERPERAPRRPGGEPGDDDPEGLVARLPAALPAGSHLVLSHLTGDFAPEAWEKVAAIYRRTGVTMQVRPRTRIEGFFTGLEPVEPGVVLVNRRRPDGPNPDGEPADAHVSVYGGVARKP